MNRIHYSLNYSSLSNKEKRESLEFSHQYNSQQVKQCLNAVNSLSENELASFFISKARLKKITMFRERHGEFKSLNSLLELDGFGVRVLEKFCDSILKKSPHIEAPKKADNQQKLPSVDASTTEAQQNEFSEILAKKQSFVSPLLHDKVRKEIKSVVGLQVDLNCISWTKISLGDNSTGESPTETALFIDDWSCYELGNEDKKFSLSDLIQILLMLNERIPTADAYVIEAMMAPHAAKQPGSVVQVNVNTQKSQLHAMMGVMMASRKSNEAISADTPTDCLKRQPNVFFLKTYLASRLYKIYIGNERVSTEHVIATLLRDETALDADEKQDELMFVPQDLRMSYRKNSRANREYLGHSMLLGLSFVKLCVLKCRQSIARLNLKNRKSPAELARK